MSWSELAISTSRGVSSSATQETKLPLTAQHLYEASKDLKTCNYAEDEMAAKFSPIEEETIFLKAIHELINEMVNFEVIKLFGENHDTEIRFSSMTHQKYFNIMLLDFLSCSDVNILGKKISYLDALRQICASPQFDINNSISNLALSSEQFIDWLEKEIFVETVWLPSINLQTNLNVKRIEFIKICGNISKHNFSRLSGVVRDLLRIFKRNELELDKQRALLIIDEFYEWFHRGIFSYHSSAIAEFLNNIRWGIHQYLVPEFQKSIVYESNERPPKYRYTYPKGMGNDFAKHCYWDLMNEIRSEPYMKKFQVTRFLKMRY